MGKNCEREERCRETQAHDKYLSIDKFDYVIENDNSLDELYMAWDELLNKLEKLHSFSSYKLI